MQGTYTVGKTKFGINFGENRDSGGALADTNKFLVPPPSACVYHSPQQGNITLAGEYKPGEGRWRRPVRG